MNNFKKILILSSHVDDSEFGCGGAISKFIEQGSEVVCIAFSPAKESIVGPDKDITTREFIKAMGVLGIKDYHILTFPVRKFPIYRQTILNTILSYKKRYNPDLVLTHSTFDIHQDHEVICQETIRAFKHTSLLGYELPWNNLTFNNQCFIDISEKNLAYKIAAIACYKSQKDRPYANPEYTEALATTRGTQINKRYAEVFEVIRWII